MKIRNVSLHILGFSFFLAIIYLSMIFMEGAIGLELEDKLPPIQHLSLFLLGLCIFGLVLVMILMNNQVEEMERKQ